MGKPQAQHRKHHALRKRYIRIEGWKTFQESKSNGTEEDASEKEKDAEETVSVEYRGERFSGYNKPKRTPKHPKKSHVVLIKDNGKDRMIRFGQQGASTAGKPKAGEGQAMKKKRASFKARHSKNIAKGKTSAAYWANKVKW